MSTRKEDLDKAFKEWKRDLDRRCDEFVRRDQKLLVPANDIIELIESGEEADAWCVYRNSVIIKTFRGKYAYQDALKFSASFLTTKF